MPVHEITTRTRLLGVLGWPVEHSLSPAIHNAALRAAGLDYIYLAFPVAPESFEKVVLGMAAAGAVGLNCTVPHKFAAFEMCANMSDEARLVGAVNTLHFRRDGIYGTNTDVEGYADSLRHDGGFDPENKRVIQIGAGGAGRAMALAVLEAGAADLTIVNRTLSNAEELAEELWKRFPRAEIQVLSSERHGPSIAQALKRADLVANAAKLGLNEGDPFPCDPSHIPPAALVFDAAYTSRGATAWLAAAAKRGCRVLDGLGMLVRQGAASLRIWTGIEPDLDAMFQALPKRR
ncbi:shikimate dehydrogenase [Candidatus Sumerlaeota bacterium]|nr:shikimate dehydrogenase [Candidatus Sumerlaeota bacterium]